MSLLIGLAFSRSTDLFSRIRATTSTYTSVRDESPTITDFTYYGVLENIYDLTYGNVLNILLFECKWFDIGKSGIREDDYGLLSVNRSRIRHVKSLVERYPDCSDAEILSMLPSTVDSIQFQNLLAQWKTEEAKAKYEQNKINRSKQMNHHIDAKSCSQRAYELTTKEGFS